MPKAKKENYDYALLSKYFRVDETSPSGVSWIESPKGRFINSHAGYKAKPPKGRITYWRVRLGNKGLFAHRIICTLLYGNIPEDRVVDHIDGNGLNNSVDNLRVVPVAINSRNVRLPKDKAEKTEVFGVSKVYQKQKGKIYEYFRANYKGQNGVCQKQFSIEKLGEEMAFFLALCWRVHWLQEDGTFTEGHGNAR